MILPQPSATGDPGALRLSHGCRRSRSPAMSCLPASPRAPLNERESLPHDDVITGSKTDFRDSMYIAMNRFKIAKGSESQFEDIWRNRDSKLKENPGFVEFHLLRGKTHERRLHAIRLAFHLGKRRGLHPGRNRKTSVPPTGMPVTIAASISVRRLRGYARSWMADLWGKTPLPSASGSCFS